MYIAQYSYIHTYVLGDFRFRAMVGLPFLVDFVRSDLHCHIFLSRPQEPFAASIFNAGSSLNAVLGKNSADCTSKYAEFNRTWFIESGPAACGHFPRQ